MTVAIPGIFIDSLSWPQVEEAMKTVRTVVIPVGARCKEHGHHLPINTDWLMAEYLARRVAEQCEVLILPTLQYGYYPAFVEYPGSVSIGEATFRDCVTDICRSFAAYGAKHFYVLNTGISTIRPLRAARELLAADGILMEFTSEAGDAEREAVRQQSHGIHADELETSMMLYIAPEVVKMELARPELAPDCPGPLTRTPGGPGVYSPTGSFGDPTLATREKGKRIVEAMVREIIAAIERISS